MDLDETDEREISVRAGAKRPPRTTSNSEQVGARSACWDVPITQWHNDDRPRERLLRYGAASLTDAELIGIIFGSGTRVRDRGFSAVQLAQGLLAAYESLSGLACRDVREMIGFAGIGPAKAAKLSAVFELARRLESSRDGRRRQASSPEQVASTFGPHMRDLKSEVFKLVFLNTANVIIAERTISEGGLATSIVEPREVFRQAVLENAAGLICLHNHPSGNPEPSREDIRVTRQLVEAGQLMGIPVHDHIIIAGRRYTSLAERGLIPR